MKIQKKIIIIITDYNRRRRAYHCKLVDFTIPVYCFDIKLR